MKFFLNPVINPLKRRRWLKKKVKLVSEKSVWFDLTNGKLAALPGLNDICIEVIRNGRVVTQGLLRNHHELDSFDSSPIDLLLSNSEDVKSCLEQDKDKNENSKMFPSILAEYYNFQYDILIRFYDSEKWIGMFEPVDKEQSAVEFCCSECQK